MIITPKEDEVITVKAHDAFTAECPTCGYRVDINIETLSLDCDATCDCGQKIHATLP